MDLRRNANSILRKFSTLIITRTANSNIYFELEDKSREMDLARCVLSAFVKKGSAVDITMTPAHRFVKDQAIAFAKHILDQMATENVTANYFLDGVENLYFLGLHWKETDASVAKSIGNDLSDFVDVLAPLIEVAEHACRLKAVDWDAVGNIIRDELVTSSGESVEARCRVSTTYFKYDRLLGAGGFGAVYKASIGEAECTMKFVPRSKLPDIEHAVADKEVATMINHPCLVQYYATFLTKEAYVTVMEYIRGVDVIRLVNSKTRLTENIVDKILTQLGLALCHLHYKGFVHRDVKPANMMIMVGCRVKLIDFDTSKVCMGKYAKRILTTFLEKTTREFNDGEVAGTIHYMAPEMLKNQEYGRAVDWWSFGMTAYVLAVGKLPFSIKASMSFEEQKAKVLKASYNWPKGLQFSREFRALMRACLSKDVSSRFCSEDYNEFAKHPFFQRMDLRWAETCSELMPFDPIDFVKAEHMPNDDTLGCGSAPATPTAEAKSSKLFPKLGLRDTDDQIKLFSFFSPGFKEACGVIQRGEVPSAEMVRRIPELVDFHETEKPFHFISIAPKSDES